MSHNHFEKIKRIIKSGLPTLDDISLFVKSLVIFIFILTSVVLFNHISTAKAQSYRENETFSSGVWNEIIEYAAGCVGVVGWGDTRVEFSNASTTAAFGMNKVRKCKNTFDAMQGSNNSQSGQSSLVPRLVEVDYGATGSILNTSASLYSTPIAMPGVTVDYYASKIRGVAHAADNPTSGRSVLAPVFFLNQAMVNLAYALVVIVLVFSGLNILLSSLTGSDEKFTLVQLLINAGVTLVFITFYYEIAAIIFDLTVNYGNALVASVMSPYINAQVILDRLQPGGDLNIIALLNTFYFTGISDSIMVVVDSILTSLLPVIAQSTIALSNAALQNPATISLQIFSGDIFGAIGNMFGLVGGISSVGISWFASNFFGRKEIFDAVIAWAVFFVNFKIFFNLISSFVSFCFMTAFGPMIVLGAINGGFERISYSFKSLIALGAVFPFTFLMILLGATSTNMFIRTSAQDTTATQGGTQNISAASATVLCKFSPSDTRALEAGIMQRDAFSNFLAGTIDWFRQFTGKSEYKAQSDGSSALVDDPREFRNRYFINQRIFDVTPLSKNGNIRDCRSSLFPNPFTFIPAPFGTIGNRAIQIQTIDSLIRSFLGVVFLITASRAPSILEEVLGVKKMGAFSGLSGSFKAGTQSFFAVGGTALSVGLPIVSSATRMASDAFGNIGFREKGSRLGFVGSGIAGIINKLKRSEEAELKKLEKLAGRGIIEVERDRNTNKITKVTKVHDPIRLNSIWKSRMQEPELIRKYRAKEAYDKTYNNLTHIGVPEEYATFLAGQTVAQNYEKLTTQLNLFGQAVSTSTNLLQSLNQNLSSFVGTLQKFATLEGIID